MMSAMGRANIARGVKLSWANPIVRANRIAGLVAAWDDPLRLATARLDVCRAGLHNMNAYRGRRGEKEDYCRQCYNARMRECWVRKKARDLEQRS